MNLIRILSICILIGQAAANLWEAVTAPSKSSMSFYSASWATNRYVVAVGNNGVGNTGEIIYSSNKGLTWKAANVTSGTTFRTLTDVASYSQNNYFLAVDYYTTLKTGSIYLSTNGGSKWTVAATKYNGKTNLPKLTSVSIGSNGNAFAAGYSFGSSISIFRSTSTSNFATWRNISTFYDAQYTFFGIGTSDGQNVIAVGTYDNSVTSALSGVIIYSSNAGSSWKHASSGSSVDVIYCVSMANASVAMIAGDNGYVAHTENGGRNWTTVNVYGTNSSLFTTKFHSISMVSPQIAFVAGFIGSKSYVYKTVNGGVSWFIDASGFSSIYSLAMYDVNLGVAGGIAGAGMYVSVAGEILYFCFANLIFTGNIICRPDKSAYKASISSTNKSAVETTVSTTTQSTINSAN